MVKKLDIEESKVLEMCVQLYKDYGTTVAGLRAIGYDFDHDDYHSFVHGRLPFEYLKLDPVLKSILNSLPIRKVAHVAEVLGRLGLGDCFDDVICFESLNSKTQTANTSKSVNEPVGLLPKSPIACKPSENAFQQAFKMANINPCKTVSYLRYYNIIVRNRCRYNVESHSHKHGVFSCSLITVYTIYKLQNSPASPLCREAVPELWESVNKSKDVQRSQKIAIETPVEA
ncbi:putative HAD superfamily protein [Helianthus annuus]|nr:putative HAD superfamily protein [Helianthus annuus]